MPPFAIHLARHGPAAPPRRWSLDAARSYCARLTRSHYENFSVASVLLPRRLVPHFYPVYAYCRWADDLADETGGGQRALDLLAWWRAELLAMYAGRPTHPVMVALRPTVERFRIPPTPFLDLLVAFEQDQRVNRYATYDELLQYCRHSANPVGRLVLYLAEAFDDERATLSDHICTALQLTNFWQDVRRDLDNLNRVYIPGGGSAAVRLLRRRLAGPAVHAGVRGADAVRGESGPGVVRPGPAVARNACRPTSGRRSNCSSGADWPSSTGSRAGGFDVWAPPADGLEGRQGRVADRESRGARLWDRLTGHSPSRRRTGTASS